MANVIRKRAVLSRSVVEPVNKNDDLKDLYVFGYQCTLFRDDEKALYIDQGKHLIPWMGNDNLLIDRYDGRGHLHDLSDYDTDRTRVALDPMTEDEKQIEKLCDEERYLELNTDVLEKMLYEEEELKRLNEALASDSSYSAVGFNYDGDTNADSVQQADDNDVDDEDLRPYVPKPSLNLPSSIVPPKTEKIHAIIERTAAFTAQHGIQMEIMIKAKQKDNAQFMFLNYEDELNAYYKHLVDYIKQGKFVPTTSMVSSSSNNNGNGSETTHSYLHPSLAASSVVSQPEPEHISSQAFLESVSAKLPAGQIANTPYAKLLSNLSKHTRANSPRPAVESNSKPVTGDYGDGKKLGTSKSLNPVSSLNLDSGTLQPGSPSQVQQTDTRIPPVPGVDPVTLPVSSCHGPHRREVTSSVDFNKSKKDLPLHGPIIIPPPPDIQPIIDKMADYVARNGPEFEFVVRRRQDERFRFLDTDHPHYAYYHHKKNLFVQEIEKKKAAEELEKAKQEALQVNEVQVEEVESEIKVVKDPIKKESDNEDEEQVEEKDEKSISKGVSFIIKTKEEEAPLLRKSTALPYESSDSSEEDEEDEEQQESDSNSDTAVSSNYVNGVACNGRYPVTKFRTETTSAAEPAIVSSSVNNCQSTVLVGEKVAISSTCGDADSKKQIDRLADKLAMAAREKLVQASRDKQLQAQRKRRAAAFLDLLRQTDPASPASDSASNVTTTVDSTTENIMQVAATSRSVTPAVSIPPSPSGGCSPSIEPIERISSPKAKRNKSPRRRKHRSRSRSPHHKRSGSRSRTKKHKKREKSPQTYTSSSRRSRSKSPRRKSSSSKQSTNAMGDRLHKSTSKSFKLETYLQSSKKRRHTNEREESLNKSKKHHKSKKSRHLARTRSSSSSSSRSPKRTSSRLHKSKRRRRSRTASSHSSDVNIIEVPDDDLPQPADSSLSEVQAMLNAKRRELLSEEIVILD